MLALLGAELLEEGGDVRTQVRRDLSLRVSDPTSAKRLHQKLCVRKKAHATGNGPGYALVGESQEALDAKCGVGVHHNIRAAQQCAKETEPARSSLAASTGTTQHKRLPLEIGRTGQGRSPLGSGDGR